MNARKKPNFSDLLRIKCESWLEPCLITACNCEAERMNITRSKFIRYAVIMMLINKGYPLKRISNKFNAFYNMVTTLQ